ncbi:S8 family peptidase [Ralstonia nicotianae]
MTNGIADLEAARHELGLPERRGMSIAVEFSPKGAFDYSSLDWKLDGIELLTVLPHQDSDVVVLHVPDGKLSAFVRRVTQYIERDNPKKPNTPKHAALVNAIANIRRAAFEELWTDSAELPEVEDPHWFQVWLRHTSGIAEDIVQQFRDHAAIVGLQVEPGFVRFPGRLVVAAFGTRGSVEQAIDLLDMVAEIRLVQSSAEYFLSDLAPAEQADWIANLLGRTTFADGDAPHVCILDTGVNNGHPLLEPALAVSDMHSYHPDWGRHDHDGHGSEMAGVALYGDLAAALQSQQPVELPHRLESVKILPPDGATPPKLWGAVTIDAVSRVEVEEAARTRIFAMMTTSVGHLEGQPSEWSATIDQLAFGRRALDITEIEDKEDATWEPRLFVLSAGNVPWTEWTEYPEKNAQSPIQNPGQSWNALTVGAATNLTQIDDRRHPGLAAIAGLGQLSPASTTSVLWSRSPWPFKPDVVAEGGNGSLEHGALVTVGPESLRVLTTAHDFVEQPLAASGDTSSAAAEVARLCAHLQARYPYYWPETIRGLVVHGAEYTAAMRATLPPAAKRNEKELLLRTYGYGMVSPVQSEYSTAHRPTLVIQRAFNPYVQAAAGHITLGEMQLHDLPWPVAELERLGGRTVEMRVTLSYFVEPNPSSRGWQSKFRYQSFALRFAVKSATEDDEQFKRRINKLERVPEDGAEFNDPDSAQWRYGYQLRSLGSLHSDVWTGTAAQLASKSKIAVFPVGGWWKDWKQMQQYDTEAHYSLIVSLKVAEDIDADLYAPITTVIEQEVGIEIDVDNSDAEER